VLTALPSPSAPALGLAWARGPRFDLLWLIGLPALGGASLLLIVPALASVTWPLFTVAAAQPHLVATYLRVYAEPQAWRRWWPATVLLPLGLGGAVLGILAWGGPVGLAALMTLSFAWAYWHYTRQAFGIARYYQRRLAGADARDRQWLWLAIHLPALSAALWFLTRLPATVGGVPVLRVPVPPEWTVVPVGLAPLALLLTLLRAARGQGAGGRGRLDLLLAGVCTSVFYLTLVFTTDALAAYVGVALWHSLQYQAFVYHAEAQRRRVARGAGFLPWVLAAGAGWRYVVFLMALAGGLFALPPYLCRVWGGTEAAVMVASVATVLVVSFHHNLLDTWIWRTPPPHPRSVSR
jgi:hypothetical protein